MTLLSHADITQPAVVVQHSSADLRSVVNGGAMATAKIGVRDPDYSSGMR